VLSDHLPGSWGSLPASLPHLTPHLLPDWLDPEAILERLGPWAFWGAVAIIFAECGLLIGFFLPGDSLLFVVGMFIAQGFIDVPVPLAGLILTISAIAGNTCGYWIGRRAGPAVFSRPDSRLFKQEYVDHTAAFFDRYGARAIVLARFVPIVRTFITVFAGVGRMPARRFVMFSAIGGAIWCYGFVVLGYLLGNVPFVKENIEVMALAIVAVSVLPIAIEWWRARGGQRDERYDEPEERERVYREDVRGEAPDA
jgi:membrane-associated protein